VYLNRVASVPWDVIVVGAVAVDLIFAVSLTRAKKRVRLLESGTRNVADANDLNAVGRSSDRVSAV
jgi:choline dehydrogenase-like flavoprotein